MKEKLHVTKTFLPAMARYNDYLQRAFDNNWLTNRGELVRELEEKLMDYLQVPHLTLTTNGTLPIQIAIKALGLKGEIITTPFSYVATTSSIVWEHCKPLFVDIEADYLSLDADKIEEAISENTTAILATHVFGNPCDVEAIEKIAEKHQLKVVYDAAHCFGVKYKGKSIFTYGDISTCSFHATKIFHTGEGGCMMSNSSELQEKLYRHHNFGHDGPGQFTGVGINAKMSELQAAMGLAVFDEFAKIKKHRKYAVMQYRERLADEDLTLLKIRPETEWNFHYFPVLARDEKQAIQLVQALNSDNIFPRRYFHPSLNTMHYVESPAMPTSESIAKRILCLPLSAEISESDIDRVCGLIKKTLAQEV